jgi:hypothetical protein
VAVTAGPQRHEPSRLRHRRRLDFDSAARFPSRPDDRGNLSANSIVTYLQDAQGSKLMDDVTNKSTIRGRPFAKGNPGRKPGSKNRATLVADALFDGDTQDLARKGLELAKSGDPSLLNFFLERIYAKDGPLQIDLGPTDEEVDPVEASTKILQVVAEGQISPSEAAALMDLLERHTRIIKSLELVERLEKLEQELQFVKETAPHGGKR